jgi:Lamin Tail Domain
VTGVRRSSYRSPGTGSADPPGLLGGARSRIGLVLVFAAAAGCATPQPQAPGDTPAEDGGAEETGVEDTAQTHESGDPVEDVPSAPDAPPPDLWVNELVADNQDGLRDEDGDPSDWIELYNATPDPVSLAGWSLTDDPDEPSKWLLPDVDLAGTDFLVVFASGKDRTEGELHANFSLSAKGEPLLLYAPDGTLHHNYDPDYPAQLPHVSYGMVQEALELRIGHISKR